MERSLLKSLYFLRNGEENRHICFCFVVVVCLLASLFCFDLIRFLMTYLLLPVK